MSRHRKESFEVNPEVDKESVRAKIHEIRSRDSQPKSPEESNSIRSIEDVMHILKAPEHNCYNSDLIIQEVEKVLIPSQLQELSFVAVQFVVHGKKVAEKIIKYLSSNKELSEAGLEVKANKLSPALYKKHSRFAKEHLQCIGLSKGELLGGEPIPGYDE